VEAGMNEEQASELALAVVERAAGQAGVSEPPGPEEAAQNGSPVAQEA
jgi:hypothetical protein